jgi:hypothetical protein
MKNIKKYKIELLSVLTLILICFLIIPKKEYLVDIYMDGDNKGIATIVELKLDYDKSSLNLSSFNSYGVLKHWNNDRFLIMPSSDRLDKPIITLKFNKSWLFSNSKLGISDQSQVYLSHIGVSDLRNSKISFNLKYDY